VCVGSCGPDRPGAPVRHQHRVSWQPRLARRPRAVPGSPWEPPAAARTRSCLASPARAAARRRSGAGRIRRLSPDAGRRVRLGRVGDSPGAAWVVWRPPSGVARRAAGRHARSVCICGAGRPGADGAGEGGEICVRAVQACCAQGAPGYALPG